VAVAARPVPAPESVRDDRVLRETRVFAIALIPVLLYAATVLVLFPGHTHDLWAWRIRAHMSSFALAVPYTAGIYYFVRLLLDGRWHRFAAGVSQLAIAGFLLLFPGTAADIWPWPLTPLTARSTAGWFAFGLVGVMLARETRWSAARIVIEAMMIGFAIALVGVARAWGEFDQGRLATWIFLATVAAVLAFMIALYAVMEKRRRATFYSSSSSPLPLGR
jgi:NADH:ubiquinone oxidoreductase subunit K